MRKYYLAPFAEQDRLHKKKLRTVEGDYLKISKCGIDYHPAGAHYDPGTYYPFASKQDRLEDDLIRVDVPGGLVGADSSHPVTHHLSIDKLSEIVGPYSIPTDLDITVTRESL